MAEFDPTKETNQGSENDAPGAEQEQEQAQPIGEYVDMPAGGLRALAAQLFPGEVDNPDAMKQHVSDLLVLNSDRLRNEDTWTIGTQVRTR